MFTKEIFKKFTEGGFRKWGYELAEREYADELASGKLVMNDIIADNFLQQILLNPEKFDVVALTNLNGDYASDALAAQVGGIGISPGANINYVTGHAILKQLTEQLLILLEKTLLIHVLFFYLVVCCLIISDGQKLPA